MQGSVNLWRVYGGSITQGLTGIEPLDHSAPQGRMTGIWRRPTGRPSVAMGKDRGHWISPNHKLINFMVAILKRSPLLEVPNMEMARKP